MAALIPLLLWAALFVATAIGLFVSLVRGKDDPPRDGNAF